MQCREEISVVIKPRMETDLAHILPARDRKWFEDDRNNVPGANTTHTVRYTDILQKILVEDKERCEYPEAFPLLEEMGMSKGWELGKASVIMNRFIGKLCAEESKKGGKKGKNKK